MDIFRALKNDHDELRGLLDQLVNASANDQSTKILLDEIKEQLIPHSRAEEAVFYNPLREVEAAKDIVGHAYTEHMKAEGLLRALRGMEMIGIEWTAAAKKLRDDITHHIEEEEGKMFEVARPLLSAQDSMQMGAAFERLKEDIENQSDFENTVDLVANLMPARFAESVRNFNNINQPTL